MMLPAVGVTDKVPSWLAFDTTSEPPASVIVPSKFCAAVNSTVLLPPKSPLEPL